MDAIQPNDIAGMRISILRGKIAQMLDRRSGKMERTTQICGRRFETTERARIRITGLISTCTFSGIKCSIANFQIDG
jgi:hypothetical protein